MGPLEWLETALKLGAAGVGVFAVSRVAGHWFPTLAGSELVQIILMGIISLGLVLAIYDRLQTREVVSMAFVLINNVGHWSMLVSMFGGLGMTWPVVAFCGLMLAGDAVKIVFFLRTGYTVRNSPRSVLLGMVGVFLVAYLTVLTIELV
jgi:hypothetical protein